MTFFIVQWVSHTDCYKRAETSALIKKVYQSEELAYSYAVKNQINYFRDHFGVKNEVFKILTDNKLSDKEKYNFIHENFELCFGEPEFTMQPTFDMYMVTEVKKFDDDFFIEDTKYLHNLTKDNINDLDESNENFSFISEC